MNRSSVYISSLSALALITCSGTAIAQSRYEPPQSSIRLAEQAAQLDMNLAEAITAAEKRTGGVAIGVRLTMDAPSSMSDADGPRVLETKATENKTKESKARSEKSQPEARNKQGQSDKTGAKRSGSKTDASTQTYRLGSEAPMYAIVTCVIDGTKVREVVVDMSDGAVLGSQSLDAGRSVGENTSAHEMQADRTRFVLVRATDLMNASARNASNDHVGDIDDLVIDPETDQIVYGVLRRGGFLGFNEARYAIPTSELTAPKDGRILLNLRKEAFEGRSGFSDEKWPTQADAQWNTHGTDASAKTPRATRILKATDLIGTNVQCNQGQKIGKITDLIVEPRSGRVVYAIVSSERGRIVVPMSVVESMGDGRVMKMTNAEVTALPTLGDDTEPDWGNAAWNQSVHERFNTKMMLTSVTLKNNRP